MTLFDLTGRTAIITGGNGGLGLAMGRGLAKAGAHVAILARNADKNAAAVEELRGLGAGDVLALTCDVAEDAAIEDAVGKVLGQFGRIDACFANAGISGAGTAIPDITAEGWDHTQAVNTRGAALVYKHVSRHMIARAKEGDAGGKLIATSSGQSIMGVNRSSDYAASKAAVNGLTRAAAFELARHRITANALLFGYFGASFASVQYSILPMLYVLLGGAGTVLGPILGAGLMFYLVDFASGLTSAYLMAVGAALVVLVLFAPKGILGAIRARWLPWLP